MVREEKESGSAILDSFSIHEASNRKSPMEYTFTTVGECRVEEELIKIIRWPVCIVNMS